MLGHDRVQHIQNRGRIAHLNVVTVDASSRLGIEASNADPNIVHRAITDPQIVTNEAKTMSGIVKTRAVRTRPTSINTVRTPNTA